MSINKTHITLAVMLTVLPCTARSQTSSRNYVKTVTMLDAAGTDSLQSVQYYNGLGYPTLSVSTTGGGQTACVMTTYDALGREKRKYLPVPGNGLGHMTESDILSKGVFYQDNGAASREHSLRVLSRRNAQETGVVRCRQQKRLRLHRPFGEEDYGAHRRGRHLLCV